MRGTAIAAIQRINMRYITFIILLILTSCENHQTVSVPQNVREVAKSFSERFGAEDYFIEESNYSDSDNSFLEVTFKNCSKVNLSESDIKSLQNSVADAIIVSFDHRKSLPDNLMISFYEGFDYYIVSRSNTINEVYEREYILSHYDSHQTYFDIEK